MYKLSVGLIIGLIVIIFYYTFTQAHKINGGTNSNRVPYREISTSPVKPTLEPKETIPQMKNGQKVGLTPQIGSAQDESDIEYRITSVIDGDTIKASINGKIENVRLIGIDSPETADPRIKVQCFGKEAANKLKELLNDASVSLESDPTQDNRDKYQRLLRYVYKEDGTFVNDYMVRNGYAFEYTYLLPYMYQDQFHGAQQYASDNNLGLWNPSTCNGKR